jgi:hypothetical protein
MAPVLLATSPAVLAFMAMGINPFLTVRRFGGATMAYPSFVTLSEQYPSDKQGIR